MATQIRTPHEQIDELGRETRASAVLVLGVLAMIVTISSVGLALS
jgi:hypothetical protein